MVGFQILCLAIRSCTACLSYVDDSDSNLDDDDDDDRHRRHHYDHPRFVAIRSAMSIGLMSLTMA